MIEIVSVLGYYLNSQAKNMYFIQSRTKGRFICNSHESKRTSQFGRLPVCVALYNSDSPQACISYITAVEIGVAICSGFSFQQAF